MGARKRKKDRDFKKIKLKIGKKLQKPNETATAFAAKKVILLDQLKSVDLSQAVSKKKLNLIELSRHARHYNPNVRKDAIVGFKEILLQQNSDQLKSDLKLFVESFLLTVFDSDSEVRSQTLACFKCLLEKIKANDLSPLFHVIVAHIVCASTNLNLAIKMQSVKFVDLLLDRLPELCAGNWPLLKCFIDLLHTNTSSSLKVDNARKSVLIRSLFRILKLSYDTCGEIIGDSTTEQTTKMQAKINPRNCSFIKNVSSPFDCPIITILFSNESRNEIRMPANLISLCDAVIPFCNSVWLEIVTSESKSLDENRNLRVFDVDSLVLMIDLLNIFIIFINELKNAEEYASFDDDKLLKSADDKYFGNKKFVQRYAVVFPCKSKLRSFENASADNLCSTVNKLLCEVCVRSKCIDNSLIEEYARKNNLVEEFEIFF